MCPSWRTLHGTAAPAVIRDGPDNGTAQTCHGTASAVTLAATEATEGTEEEEYDGCDGADPRRRLDDALLSLAADGILLCSIVVTTAGAAATAVGSTAIVTMSMPAIDVIAIHWVGGLEG